MAYLGRIWPRCGGRGEGHAGWVWPRRGAPLPQGRPSQWLQRCRKNHTRLLPILHLKSCCISWFFLCNLKVNLAVIWIGMKILVKVILESLHFETLSMSPDWIISLWSWRHPDGEMAVVQWVCPLTNVYGNIFCKLQSRIIFEALAHSGIRFSSDVAAMFFPTGLDLNTPSRLNSSIPCVRKSEKKNYWLIWSHTVGLSLKTC